MNHYATVSNERRLAMRVTNLRGILPGKLLIPSTHEYLRARALDVSKAGLCVLLDKPLKDGLAVWMILEDRYLKFEVANCMPSKKEKNLYRVGLSLCEGHENLIELFQNLGCMVSAYMPPGRLKNTGSDGF